MTTGIERAIESAGSQAKLGDALGVSQQVISLWLKEGGVPAARAAEIEHLTGVPRADLLPPKLRNIMSPAGGEL